VKRIRVVHIIIGLNRGGAEMMLERGIKYSMTYRSQLNHTVVSMTDLGSLGASLRESGIEVVDLGMRSAVSAIGGGYKLFKLLVKARPDVVQTWMVHADVIGGVIARLAGVKVVVWGVRTTDFRLERWRTRALFKLQSLLSYIIPHQVVCAAQASASAAIDAGFSKKSLSVLHNGFAVEQLLAFQGQGASIRSGLGISKDELLVGCIGRFHQAKDPLNFVKAARLLLNEFPRVRFLMCGRGMTWANPELAHALEDPSERKHFILMEETKFPAAVIDALDIFVLPSRSEGFPNVLGEAMAMGLPSVTTDVGDAKYILGNNGWVVEPRDHNKLAAAIRRLILMSRDDRRAIGLENQARLIEFFSLHAWADRQERIYIDLCRQNGPLQGVQ
jgi:glycosyltransferase involved in cell wall biosynthesis